MPAGGVVTLPHHTVGYYYGVDTLAVAGNKVYLGYPDDNYLGDDPTSLAVVDLTDYSVTSTMVLSKSVSYPTGVAVVPPIRIYLPLILR